MNLYSTLTLSNGFRLIHQHRNSPVMYMGVITDAGTRDETKDEHGVAHFIEHLLFKGTKKRSARQIVERIESAGGEINAFTNKEETVVYITCLKQESERAMELLADMLFNPLFRPADIEKEREVIMDEIWSYEDSPAELIFDHFENIIFKGAPLGHSILGTEESVRGITQSHINDFHRRYYQPQNMVFFAMGGLDFDTLTGYAGRFFGGVSAAGSKPERKTAKAVKPFRVEVNKSTAQMHAMLGSPAYGMHHTNKAALILLNNLLGGAGMSSRLNMSLREKAGLVYTIESNYSAFSDCGLLTVYYGADPKKQAKCHRRISEEIDRLMNNSLSERELKAAKRQMRGMLLINREQCEGLALSLGKCLLRYNRFDSLEEAIARIDGITADNVLEAARHVFGKGQLSELIYC
jgi:predicted Zn-dependent peptidase